MSRLYFFLAGFNLAEVIRHLMGDLDMGIPLAIFVCMTLLGILNTFKELK